MKRGIFEFMAFYTQDKTQRITLRLNEKQFGFIKENADILGVSPSDFLRMVINSTMNMTEKLDKKISDKLADSVVETKIDESDGVGRENDKTDKHDIV